MQLTVLLKTLDIITKFLLEKRPYEGFKEETLQEDAKEILKGTVLLQEWKREHTLEKPSYDWQCPTCGYHEYPDWCPLDYYVANGQIYPKRENFGESYNYYYGVKDVSWDETHFCPYCEKEFTYGNSTA